ncbi:uncharacterized protein LOC114646739 isoform X2 [Erpetoichthys calabaricus]|uniref:uncharacterized protein LOC114646739 isoform X2 n=1 Tax=Erpetoichthys calabaricus TaxID=27687 RepID=UPI0022348243|nr:uncharacterized protein LOC114646739 isoform X2 [Erpetoichthys calabaricus]
MAALQSRRKPCVFRLACHYCPFRKARKKKSYDIWIDSSATSGSRWSALDSAPSMYLPDTNNKSSSICLEGISAVSFEQSTLSVLQADSEHEGTAMDTDGPLSSICSGKSKDVQEGSDSNFNEQVEFHDRIVDDQLKNNWKQQSSTPSVPEALLFQGQMHNGIEMDIDIDPETGERALGRS